tara:strand:- start:234 stop:1001 length:768 start_codon:yes stop_codon:yes gene_type:complete
MLVSINNLKKAEQFVHLFQFLKLFTNSLNILFNKDRFYVQGMDSSHVSVFEASLKSDWFDVYDVNEDTIIGINVSLFFKILNIRSDSHKINIIQHEDNLDVELISELKSEYNKFFNMPLMDLEIEQLNIQETDSSLIFSMESKKFKTLIDQFSNFGEDIEFKYSDDELMLISDNNTEGSMKINIKLDDMESCEVEENANFKCSYNLKIISNMAQFQKLTADVFLHISPEMPFQLIYNLDDDNYVRFFLAPKISDD